MNLFPKINGQPPEQLVHTQSEGQKLIPRPKHRCITHVPHRRCAVPRLPHLKQHEINSLKQAMCACEDAPLSALGVNFQQND